MNRQLFTDPYTGDRCIKIDHPSGLPILLYPKEGYTSSYAVFATRYGSIDNRFLMGDEMVDVPAGIAHYLEHKLFESEEGDAFERYAATGASANAYTSFDRTAYLFSATGDIRPSLEILLDFVQKPYFTPETVQKEQGIIGQEIHMGQDSPGRRVFLNLLSALYSEHPVRIDIAGTVESIAKITPELLYGCYDSFYNLHNMVLVVAGNATEDQVLEAADRLLKPAKEWAVERPVYPEPATVTDHRIVQEMPVAAPVFYLGFKYPMAGNACPTATQEMAADVLLELIAGRASDLYTRLMDEGLINRSFGGEFFSGPGYAAFLFGGESRDPDKVTEEIKKEIDRLRREGIDPAAFAAARNAQYGTMVSDLNNVEDAGDLLVDEYFSGMPPFALIEAAATLQISDVEDLLNTGFDPDGMALSVITPMQKEEE